ncbi:hypothetical protein LCGC14_2378540 [marine sediment metagenome]|uniref:Uncharacterized protein n=1 Tax=marine sediment metagenome TaxID=412755 RepID=A0A0F9CNU2_9ZZZZ
MKRDKFNRKLQKLIKSHEKELPVELSGIRISRRIVDDIGGRREIFTFNLVMIMPH